MRTYKPGEMLSQGSVFIVTDHHSPNDGGIFLIRHPSDAGGFIVAHISQGPGEENTSLENELLVPGREVPLPDQRNLLFTIDSWLDGPSATQGGRSRHGISYLRLIAPHLHEGAENGVRFRYGDSGFGPTVGLVEGQEQMHSGDHYLQVNYVFVRQAEGEPAAVEAHLSYFDLVQLGLIPAASGVDHRERVYADPIYERTATSDEITSLHGKLRELGLVPNFEEVTAGLPLVTRSGSFSSPASVENSLSGYIPDASGNAKRYESITDARDAANTIVERLSR